MNTTLDYYFSSDLNLSTVISLYFPIDSIDKSNPQKAVFIFRRENGLDDLIANYWARRLQIEPQALLTQLKSTKTRLYET
jgi:hypothetical protein